MHDFLFAWLGQTDINASQGVAEASTGPIARVAADREFEQVVLLNNYEAKRGADYRNWLTARIKTPVTIEACPLESPVDYGDIYRAASEVVERYLARSGARSGRDRRLVFHLSPGTPAMAATWIILAKTRYLDHAELIRSSVERGVESVDFPFDLYAELAPDFLRRSDDELVRLTQGLPPETPEFEHIVHRCEGMQRVIALARRLAVRDLPVLIEGESGTGKELLARAIHSASPRRNGPFLPVNCGGIPQELIDSELFGHKKGTFTGAVQNRKGMFEEAAGGTLFLDEIGELPKSAQVRLLRALQEKRVRRVGEAQERTIDVRIISATHKNLLDEVAANQFREDLFHRVAVGIVQIPPLRRREGDLGLLVDHLLKEVNREASASQPGFREKKISPMARTLLLQHPWPGNVRELRNTLLRASVWAVGAKIEEQHVQEALLAPRSDLEDQIMERPLAGGFSIYELINEVKTVYLRRALKQSDGKKTKAARLLGVENYQTVTQWMDKLGVKN